MPDMIEPTPSERDEQIYEAWQSGKTLRVCAREFSTSVIEVERAIDRCLPIFNTASEMRAYKREIRRTEDVTAYYYAKAMEGDIESAHVYARVNERRCSMSGWSSVSVRLDPYQAQVKEQPTQHERVRDAIMGFWDRMPPAQKALRERLQKIDAEEALRLLDAAGVKDKDKGNGAAVLAPPTAPSVGGENR